MTRRVMFHRLGSKQKLCALAPTELGILLRHIPATLRLTLFSPLAKDVAYTAFYMCNVTSDLYETLRDQISAPRCRPSGSAARDHPVICRQVGNVCN